MALSVTRACLTVLVLVGLCLLNESDASNPIGIGSTVYPCVKAAIKVGRTALRSRLLKQLHHLAAALVQDPHDLDSPQTSGAIETVGDGLIKFALPFIALDGSLAAIFDPTTARWITLGATFLICQSLLSLITSCVRQIIRVLVWFHQLGLYMVQLVQWLLGFLIKTVDLLFRHLIIGFVVTVLISLVLAYWA